MILRSGCRAVRSTMKAHRIETTVTTDGQITITNVPVHAGDAVEVIVLVKSEAANTDARYPLRGSVARYERPTDPVASDDWETDG
jgi:hypothetical protein